MVANQKEKEEIIEFQINELGISKETAEKTADYWLELEDEAIKAFSNFKYPKKEAN